MRDMYRHQDFALLRLFIQATDSGRTLRWRKGNQQPFRSAHQVGRMREDNTQHSAGMIFMANCIITKAGLEGDVTTSSLNLSVLVDMISTHDIDEYLAGDSRKKTAEYRARELRARAITHEHMGRSDVGKVLVARSVEYHAKLTPEARFTKALDEMQAWVYIIQTRGFKMSNRDFMKPDEIPGYELALEFPTLARLARIMLRIMKNPKFITTEVQELHVID